MLFLAYAASSTVCLPHGSGFFDSLFGRGRRLLRLPRLRLPLHARLALHLLAAAVALLQTAPAIERTDSHGGRLEPFQHVLGRLQRGEADALAAGIVPERAFAARSPLAVDATDGTADAVEFDLYLAGVEDWFGRA
jgi:hypothetical protein